MRGRKKITSEEAEIEDEPLEIDPETPVVQEHHQVTRRWRVRKTLDEIENDQGEFVEDPAPSTDPVQAVLDDMMGSTLHTWSIAVLRLKNYARDQRNDVKAGSHCGVLSVPDATYIAENKYVEEIQSRWARGLETNFFLPIIRRDNRIHKYLPVVAVEPPDPLMIARQAAENPGAPINYYLQPPAPPQDGFKQFLAQAKQFAELRDLLLPPDYTPAQQPAINTTEQALLHLANADGALVESLTDRIGKLLRRSSDGSHEVTVMDLLLEAIKTDLPARIFKEARNLILEVKAGIPANGAAPPPSSEKMGPGRNLPQPVGFEPEAQTIPASIPPESVLLNFTINACAQHKIWTPETSAEWIIEFEQRNPNVTPYISAFLNMTPEAALDWLVQAVPEAREIAAMPHARDWIAALQRQLQPEDDAGEKKN